MRLLRAALAVLLLAVLLAGVPLLLALTVGNPLPGWDGLLAGDLSDTVLLDILAAAAWVAWANFVWAVIGEIVVLAAGTPRPHLPVLVPGTQHLAHSLVTAAFLILPSTGAVLHSGPATHTTPAAITLHVAATAADTPRPRATDPITLQAAPQPRTAAHRAAEPSGDAPLVSSSFALGAGAGLVAGISLRELARLRRRQWRHRRPGRAIAATPAALAPTEKALARRGGDAISDTDRAQVLATRATTQDQAMPPARGQAPWDAFCDAAGAPLPQFTLTRPDATTPPPGPSSAPTPSPVNPGTGRTEPSHSTGHDTTDRPTGDRGIPTLGLSVLNQPISRVLTTSATTARDVTTLAPQVHDRIRRLIARADPGLDDDLAAWHDPSTRRPRLSVLGPVTVRAVGHLPSPRPRRPWHTEVLTYLAAHPQGVSPERFGTDLWPHDPDILTKPKLRQAIYVVRHWLGTNPRTGLEYVPQTKPAAGSTLWRVEDLLSDAELFRRLRLRGITHGPHGIHDLETALTLVTGPPFDPAQRRRDGYTWLIDTPVDTESTAMIIDVAHVVATHHLSTARPDLAAQAARVSLTAGSRDDIPLLDLIAACDAQGHHGEATHWIQQILTNHDTIIEEDLPPRTAEILHRRQWHHAS